MDESLYEAIKQAKNPADAYRFTLSMLTRKKRVLNSVLIELTPVCNFRCPFCYARKTSEEIKVEGAKVQRFDYWKGIFNRLAEKKVMTIGFTGGECMLHQDFADIYRYAVTHGFIIGMISNCSCLTDEILDLFTQYPPKNISVTVYGASQETYQRVCGKAEYFDTVMRNLRRLKEHRIPFTIQTTVSKDNVEDLPAIQAISRELGVQYMFSEALTAFKQCSTNAAVANSADETRINEITQRIDRETDLKLIRRHGEIDAPKVQLTKGVGCSAGRNSAFINYRGCMEPCVNYDGISVSLDEHTVDEAWNMIVAHCDEIPYIEECNGCIHWNRCRHCFALHYHDTHDFTKPSPRFCFKRLHPEEAARIEAYYAEHGKLPPFEG